MGTTGQQDIPVGTKALILSKLYYGVLSKSLENVDVERYYSILYFIYNNNGCTQQQICNNLAIDKTAMVKVIDYLIKLGFVERTKNPTDRREHIITLTKKGMKQTGEVVSAFKQLDEKIFSGISDQDRDIFIDVLVRVSAYLSELPANDLFFNYTKTSTPKHLTETKIHPNEEST